MSGGTIKVLRARAVAVKNAQRAGLTLDTGALIRPSIVDAIVTAVAHAHRDAVLTTDPDDLRTLAAHFRGLKVLAL